MIGTEDGREEEKEAKDDDKDHEDSLYMVPLSPLNVVF